MTLGIAMSAAVDKELNLDEKG